MDEKPKRRLLREDLEAIDAILDEVAEEGKSDLPRWARARMRAICEVGLPRAQPKEKSER